MPTTASRAVIDPGEVSFQKRILAGTTFDFAYPNPHGYARGVFPERNKRVVIRFRDSDVTLDGVVWSVSNDPVSRVECVDPMGLLRDKKVTVEFLDGLAGRDCARAIADIILDNTPDFVTEAIEGTNPLVTLPQGFIDKQTAANAVIQNILQYIRDETNRLSPAPIEYFMGFIAGTFRFMKVPAVTDEVSTITITKSTDIYEEEPVFHFDRLINRARVTGKDDADGNPTEGLTYSDEHSIAMYGVREPDQPLTLDTDDPILLYKRARDVVEANKTLTYSRRISVPDGYFLTPGIHTIDIQQSPYGVRGKARVMQVEGDSGSGGRVTVTLASIPLDDAEVYRKIVNG